MPEVGKRLIAGAMSGTSADGVDVAIVEVTGRGLAMTARPLSHAYEAFSPELRRAILDMRQAGASRFDALARMGREITLAYARAFRAAATKANVTASDIAAIGAHGQTLWHGPPNTIQYFDPSLLAIETGCAVVSDFRRADLAVGGQGAPLVPFADWILFRHPDEDRVVVNIGGIANITILPAGCPLDRVIAFDTGPGNCISDWLMADHGGVDLDGALAASGQVRNAILKAIDHDAYFEKPIPKSTDGPAMVDLFRRACEAEPDATLADKLATAAFLTASTIEHGVGFATRSNAFGTNGVVWICGGGGVRNNAIMDCMRTWRPKDRAIRLTSEFGIATDAREAIAFALLAAATLDGEPSNVPSATGASRKVVLGSVTPRPI